jgi:hypothetical protein
MVRGMSGPRSRYASGDPSAGAPAEDLTSPTPPAPQSLASTATTASVTWTHAGAPPGTTYALTVVDSEDDEIAPDSGTGLGPWVIPVVSGRAYRATLAATGSDDQTSQSSALVQVTPDIGADFPLEGAAGWRVVYSADLTDQGSQGPFAAGSGTFTVDGASIPYVANAAAGTFNVNNNTTIGASGLVMVATSTASQLPQFSFTIPLGETWGPDVSMRVRARIRGLCGDTTDSFYLYVAAPDVTPANDTASTAKIGGMRILGQTTTVTTRRGGAASAGSTKPAGWANDTTDLYVEFLLAPYANDMIVFIDDASFASGESDLVGRTQSRDSNPTVTLPIWQDDSYETIKVFIAIANGGSGAGLPKIALKALQVELR